MDEKEKDICSRIGGPPSDKEMAAVCTAVRQAFAPMVLLQADNIGLYVNDDGEHHLRRLYWPLEKVSLVTAGERPVQPALWE